MGSSAKAAKRWTGLTFGRLTIIEYIPGRVGIHPKARCQCSCGKQAVVMTTSLRCGLTKSCGCLNQELRISNNTIHGMTSYAEHHIWASMHQRCSNPNHEAFENYGGRGITVCERWGDFENFYADMGSRPSLTHTIEREDNSKNYEPGNCIWATRKAQARNRRSNRTVTFNGETKTVAEWAEEKGIGFSTLHARLFRHNYSIEEAMTKPRYSRGGQHEVKK